MSIIPKKASARVEIAFLDNPDGRVATVPGSRLRVPWAEVAAFDARMADWQRLDDLDVDRTEEGCIEEVCRLLIPEDVAELLGSPVCCAIRILDKARLNTIIGVPVDEVLAAAQWFDRDGQLVVSPAGTLLIVEAACRANPMPVLNQVIEQEIESRHKCKHGSEHIDVHTRKNEPTSPEWEYERYRRFDRPRHELLRQWCGHRAVTLQERLLAAEAETERLDILLAEVVEALAQAGKDMQADIFRERHERERVTAHTVRPVVDRPLHPSEIPVREIRVRRRWGY